MRPLVLLTGQVTKSEMRQRMTLGADDFLMKPAMIGELVAAIRRRLQKQAIVKQDTDASSTSSVWTWAFPVCMKSVLLSVALLVSLKFSASTSNPWRRMRSQKWRKIILKPATRLGHMVENFLTFVQLAMLSATSTP
jgi:hypothetical protein